MTFSVEDEDGTVLASGQSLDALRDELRPRLRARLERAAPALARHGMRSFDIPSLPRDGRPSRAACVASRRWSTRATQSGCASVRRAGEQAVTMARGTRRLLRLTVPSPRSVGDRPARNSAHPQARGRAPRHAGRGDRGRDRRGARRAHREWRWTGVGRRGLCGPPRARPREPPAHDARGAGRARRDPRGGSGRPRAARHAPGDAPSWALHGRTSRASWAGSSTPGCSRARASRDWVTSSATCARLRSAWSGCRAASPPTASGWPRSTSWRPRPPDAVTAMWLIEEVRVAQLAPGAHVRPGATVKRVREALAVG